MKIMKKHSERLKVQNILEKIKEDCFSSEDIDLLLIKLREYTEPKSLLEEIAHFAAHNESRNKGIAFTHLSSFFDSMLFQFNHSFDGGEPLDFSKPIPVYVINKIKYNLTISSINFKQKYRCSPTQFESRFNNTFQKIRSSNTYKLKGTLKGVVKTVVEDMLSLITSGPFCHGREILNEIFLVLQKNEFQITLDELNLRYEKIILFIIYLMHNTEYQITDSIVGFSRISIGQYQASNIELIGTFPTTKEGVLIGFTLIATDISSDLLCSDTLLVKRAQDYSQLIINSEGKLDFLPSP